MESESKTNILDIPFDAMDLRFSQSNCKLIAYSNFTPEH